MKRKRINKSRSRRDFKRNASRIHPKNNVGYGMSWRGGIRL